jgi:hypothetical protein
MAAVKGLKPSARCLRTQRKSFAQQIDVKSRYF